MKKSLELAEFQNIGIEEINSLELENTQGGIWQFLIGYLAGHALDYAIGELRNTGHVAAIPQYKAAEHHTHHHAVCDGV